MKGSEKKISRHSKGKRLTVIKVVLVMVSMLGIAMAAYPFISDCIYSQATDSMILAYKNDENSMEQAEAERLLEEAEAYNQALSRAHIVLSDPFGNEYSSLTKEEYDSMLRPDDGSAMMGYISIPCINVELPIFHGTSDSELKKGVGHLEGTSLPVGGESTHTVLTGHTGMNNARLFTDLSEMAVGDRFFISVLGRTLCYEVFKISVVMPDETDALGIVKGSDLCTLVTCTPYGVNSHRLLVAGVRVEDVQDGTPASTDSENDMQRRDSQWMGAYKQAFVLGIIVVIIMFVAVKIHDHHRKAGERDVDT